MLSWLKNQYFNLIQDHKTPNCFFYTFFVLLRHIPIILPQPQQRHHCHRIQTHDSSVSIHFPAKATNTLFYCDIVSEAFSNIEYNNYVLVYIYVIIKNRKQSFYNFHQSSYHNIFLKGCIYCIQTSGINVVIAGLETRNFVNV